eukprot:CAMPEP_0194398500 /NCGR_PEP_ID=MMETSP0174-20130528/126135_1 /TAXON_ID=216777 /ORGANISM="Proboscia alata, Strain PI-D3" /LENGTH=311 /DNA_ID=CAMNT_0039194797 /DNA_START=23 /DNA_END=957 /DNA_ORIENTATION=-
MSSLSQLRANLEKVQSFQIPERYCHIPHASLSSDENDRNSNTPRHALSLDEDVKRRYFKARDQYLTQRIEELFVHHITTFDGTYFEFPDTSLDDEKCSIIDNVTDDNKIAEEDETLKSLTETRYEDVKRRYFKARDQYLTQRIEELFVQHVNTFDGTDFELPDTSHVKSPNIIQEEESKMMDEISTTASSVAEQYKTLIEKHALFDEKRTELAHIVSDMEKEEESKARKSNETSDSMDDDECSTMDNSIDDDEIAQEEETLRSLMESRLEMEDKLRRVQSESEHMKLECQRFINDQSVHLSAWLSFVSESR